MRYTGGRSNSSAYIGGDELSFATHLCVGAAVLPCLNLDGGDHNCDDCDDCDDDDNDDDDGDDYDDRRPLCSMAAGRDARSPQDASDDAVLPDTASEQQKATEASSKRLTSLLHNIVVGEGMRGKQAVNLSFRYGLQLSKATERALATRDVSEAAVASG
jgi:hypothetical protein